MELKLILTILITLIALKSVENASCLEWPDWNSYKMKYYIQFYNLTLELNA